MDTIQYKLTRKLTKPKTTSQKSGDVKVKNDYCQAHETAAPTKKSTKQENLKVRVLISVIPGNNSVI